jgi:trimeric autotransporter adhesin
MLKTVSSVVNAIGALNYKGTWNASTNNPTLTSGVGTKGDYYVVSVAGSTNLDGETLWGVGDWAAFNGSIWQKVDGGDSGNFVNISVSSLTGYMYANGTSNVTASTTIPVANVTGAVPNTVNVLAGTGLSGGGALTGNVTLNLANTAVTAGSYGSSSNTAQITIDAQGRITSASNVAIPQGTVTSITAGTGLSGGTITSSGTIALSNTAVTAATYGSANTVSQVTINAQGQVTNAVNVAIAIANSAVSGLGTMSTQNANNVTITGGTENNLTYTNVSISSGNAMLTNVTAGNVNVTYRGTSSNTGAVNVGGNLSSADIGIIASFVGNATTYAYVAVQNTNNSNTSYTSISTISDGFTAYSDLGTNSTNYSYSAAGFPNNAVSQPSATFLVGYSGNVAIASWNANAIHFLANASSSTTSAMVINGNNSVTINTLGQTTSATATFATSSLPLVPAGYLQFTLANATVVKVPYYAS